VLNAQIRAIMARDYRSWLSFSFDRLRQFGYRFNTY